MGHVPQCSTAADMPLLYTLQLSMSEFNAVHNVYRNFVKITLQIFESKILPDHVDRWAALISISLARLQIHLAAQHSHREIIELFVDADTWAKLLHHVVCPFTPNLMLVLVVFATEG